MNTFLVILWIALLVYGLFNLITSDSAKLTAAQGKRRDIIGGVCLVLFVVVAIVGYVLQS
jgi:hypothetical protein